MQIELGFDVAVGDFQARFETALDQRVPGQFGLQPVLERVGAGAALGQHLRQLRRVGAHPAADIGEGIVDFRVGHVDAEFLGLADLQDLVDKTVQHLLAGRRLLGAHLDELGALLDIERRDRFAIDQRHDLLRTAHRGNGQQACRGQCDGGEGPAQHADRSLRHHLLLSFDGRPPAGSHLPPFPDPAPINRTNSRQNLECGPHRAQGIGAERAQAHLQHECVVLHRGRYRGIGVAGKPIHREKEAIVGIADTEPRLIDFFGVKIVTRRAEQNPVLRKLERSAAEDALTAEQEAEFRLRCVIAV